MKIKTRMIGMDLDGTLLKSDKELTQYTKDVLKRAIEQFYISVQIFTSFMIQFYDITFRRKHVIL